MWFAEEVSNGNNSIKARQVADIDFNNTMNMTWKPIGSIANNFKGSYDGQGYKLFNLPDMLFGTTRDATLTNIAIESGSVNGLSADYATELGSLVGSALATTNITKCYSKADVTNQTENSYTGGLVGMAESGSISYCYYIGSVSGSYGTGGLLGSSNYTNFSVTGCYVSAPVTSSAEGKSFAFIAFLRSNSMTNCYVNSDVCLTTRFNDGNKNNAVVLSNSKTTAQLESGELCYYLNGSTSEGELAWGQLIGTDPTPVFNNGANTVYYNGDNGYFNTQGTLTLKGISLSYKGCDKVITATLSPSGAYASYKWYRSEAAATSGGTLIEGETSSSYTPTAADLGYYIYVVAEGAEIYEGTVAAVTDKMVTEHSYNANGFCSVCDSYEQPVFNNGAYEISNAGQLFSFSNIVNGGNNSANARLMCNIDLENRNWISIGSYGEGYCGTFDGQGYSVSNMKCNGGLFRYLKAGCVVQNLTIKNSIGNLYYTDSMGGIADIARGNILIENCNNYMNRRLGNIYSYGGIVGEASDGVTIRGCSNYGNIIFSAESYNIGGIVGYASNGVTIEQCANFGAVTGGYKVGGIAGCCKNISNLNCCYNTGDITGYNTGWRGEGTVNPAACGIIGYISSNKYMYLQSCYTVGKITGTVEGQSEAVYIEDTNVYCLNIFYLSDTDDWQNGKCTMNYITSGGLIYALNVAKPNETVQIWGQRLTSEGGLPFLSSDPRYDVKEILHYNE